MIVGGPVAQLAGDPIVSGGTHVRIRFVDAGYSMYNVSAGIGFLEGLFPVIVKDGVDEYFTLNPSVPNLLRNPSAAYYYTPDSIDGLKDPSADAPIEKTTSTVDYVLHPNSVSGEPFFREAFLGKGKKFPTSRFNGY